MNRIRFIWLLLLFSHQLLAQDDKPKFEGLLNKLLAPGPLIMGHSDLEHKDCLKCHEAGGGIPNQKCSDCHKEIRAHITSQSHFHGLMKGKACIDCHKDHKGRAYDAAYVNEKTFEHEKTGFNLTGAHGRTECEKCHVTVRKNKAIRAGGISYFGAKNSCIACHKSEDIHFFTSSLRKKECSACHSTEKWKPAKDFDHSKQGHYPLLGAHSKFKCDKCHVKEGKRKVRYDWPIEAKQCLSCHKDQHGDKLSPRFRNGKCDVCHSQETWKLKL